MEGWILLLWVLVFFTNGALLFIQVYSLININDLESDHLNPSDFCSKMNPLVRVDYVTQVALTVFLLLTGRFLAFAFNLPLAAFEVYTYVQSGINYDVTAVLKSSYLNPRKRIYYVKIALYIIVFFYYMYCLINSILDVMIGGAGLAHTRRF